MHVRELKRWLAPLRRTPLHPQWLIRQGLQAEDLRAFQGSTLDIGCADRAAQRLLPGQPEYIGLDYYPTAVEWYATRPDVFGDARCLPLADECVDNVLMLHVLEHIDRPQLALAELRRVLRPGGRALLEVPFIYPLHDAPLDFRRWTRHGLDAELRASGLLVERVVAIGRATETAALLFNLALARLALDWLDRRSPWLLLAPLLALLVPVVNLIGGVLAPLQPDADFMPHRVRVLCRKPE